MGKYCDFGLCNLILVAIEREIIDTVRLVSYLVNVINVVGGDVKCFVKYVHKDVFTLFIRLVGKWAKLEVERCDKEIVEASKKPRLDFDKAYKAQYHVILALHPAHNFFFVLCFDFEYEPPPPPESDKDPDTYDQMEPKVDKCCIFEACVSLNRMIRVVLATGTRKSKKRVFFLCIWLWPTYVLRS